MKTITLLITTLLLTQAKTIAMTLGSISNNVIFNLPTIKLSH